MFPGLGDLISCLSQIQSWCRVGSSWGGGRFKSQLLLYATQKAFTFWRATASLAALIKPRAPSHSQPVKIIKEALGHKAIIQFMLLHNYFVRNWVAWADPKLFGVAVISLSCRIFPCSQRLLSCNQSLGALLSCSQGWLWMCSSQSYRQNISFMPMLNCWNSPHLSVHSMN